jgi:chemotaxis protein methyltransferase WspC
MPLHLENFLAQHIGLDVQSVGSSLIAQAAAKRRAACGLDDTAYLAHLEKNLAEQNALIDLVVVLETWFFRNHAAFEYLNLYATRLWQPRHTDEKFRVLSLPCATGEEPYSVTMSLLTAGVPATAFEVEAVDISKKALDAARLGVYGPGSFRGQTALDYRSRYFEAASTPLPDKWIQINAQVRQQVQFFQDNLTHSTCLYERPAYAAIFCRNLLIYLTPEARQRALRNLLRLLQPDGLLFVGHAERSLVCHEQWFVQVQQPGIFACRKKASASKEAPVLPEPAPVFSKPVSAPLVVPPPQPPSAALPQRPSPIQQRPVAEAVTDKASLLAKTRSLADQGHLEAAQALCEQLIRQQPTLVDAHFLAGFICQARNEDSEAERYFNQTLFLDPNHLATLYALAFLVERRGQTKAATLLRARAQRLTTKEPS